MKKHFWMLSLVAVSLFVPVPSVRAQQSTGRIRVLHAAQQEQLVDVFVDGAVLLNSVAFQQASSYLDVPSGRHTLAITRAGGSAADALATTPLNIATNQSYTVVAVEHNGLQARVLPDDLSPVPAGKARMRFVHASPDAPGADIDVLNGPTLFEHIAFGQASQYTLVDAGSYNLRAITTGTNAVFTQVPNTLLNAGVVYDIVAAGRLADLKVQTLSALPSAQAAPPARMPNTGAGDAWSSQWLLCAVLLIIGGLSLRCAAR